MIIIAPELRARIAAAAEAAYPEECCGLLVGRQRTDGVVEVTRVVESPNVAEGGHRDSFEVDPRVRLAVMRETRSSGEEIIGHYHSHPDHPAAPSVRDRAMAFEPELAWLIVAVVSGRVGAMAAFRLVEAEDAFRELPIVGPEERR
jgi:proteasome lid subunit RPN8/RPN11